MVYFLSDYSQGAHPAVMEALTKTNEEHTIGYGTDVHCENAERLIKNLIGREDCQVHMMVGGTPCNVTTIAAGLRPFEAVIAPRTGHIYSHETGAVEGTGHKIITINGVNGKITAEQIDQVLLEHEDEHTPRAKMVYISQPTEIGSIYSKAEMTSISDKCRERGLMLYVDGARLGAALTSKKNDLSIQDLAQMADAFYIGGTKNGALLGEALVISNPELNKDFRYMIKHNCSMLAKGRLIGVQFEALFEGGEDCAFYQIGRHENELAEMIHDGFEEMGFGFYSESYTNQMFPVLPTKMVEELEKEVAFYRWAPEVDGMTPVRFVTGWGTTKEDVEKLLEIARKAM